MIRKIEEVSLNAIPAKWQYVYDGWILRFLDGYTGRANSVYPLYKSDIDIDTKISECEKIYESYNIPSSFKMTYSAMPDGLEDILIDRGYVKKRETSVRIANIKDIKLGNDSDVMVEDGASPQWIQAFLKLNDVSEKYWESAKWLLMHNSLQQAFASIVQDGKIIAVGRAVIDREYIGLFGIATDSAYRQQGYGNQIVRALLTCGGTTRVELAYLQVMSDNEPAINLYEKFGFSESYRYWYRVKAINEE